MTPNKWRRLQGYGIGVMSIAGYEESMSNLLAQQ
jgi:hypothetical protein